MPDWISSCTLANCGALASGPSTVASSSGSPTTIALAASAASASNSASLAAGTTIRVGEAHDWPQLRIMPSTPLGTAVAKSASGRNTLGDLPPSSCTTRLTVVAAFCATSTPARVEPVNETMSTSGWPDIAAPTTSPVPMTRLNTPAGVPASCITCANSSAVSGDSSLGLSTTVHPAASAGATLAVIWYNGQFHGVIAAQTPIGSLRTWMPFTSLSNA